MSYKIPISNGGIYIGKKKEAPSGDDSHLLGEARVQIHGGEVIIYFDGSMDTEHFNRILSIKEQKWLTRIAEEFKKLSEFHSYDDDSE